MYQYSRRTVLCAVGAAGVSALTRTGAASRSATSTDGWPQYGYDARNSGHTPGHTGPKTDVGVRWRYDTQGRVVYGAATDGETVYVGGTEQRLVAVDGTSGDRRWSVDLDSPVLEPVVVDGSVYVGDDEGRLHAFDAGDGTELWHADFGAETFQVVDGTVYVSDHEGVEQSLHAFDADDGTELWHLDVEQRRRMKGSPLVDGDTVYVTVDGPIKDTEVLALDATDGSERWRVTVDDALSVGVDDTVVVVHDERVSGFDPDDGSESWSIEFDDRLWVEPAVSGGTVAVFGPEQYLYGFDADDGTETWRLDVGDVYLHQRKPMVAENTLFVVEEPIGETVDVIRALDPADGSLRWETEFDEGLAGDPIVDDGVLFAPIRTGGESYAVAALGVADGTERWRGRLPARPAGSLAVGTDAVFAACGNGHTYAFDQTDGARRSLAETGGQVGDPPTVQGGRIYFSDSVGNVHAVSSTDGSEQWQTGGTPFASPPAVVDGTAYVVRSGWDAKRLHAVDAEEGTESWSVETAARLRTQPTVAAGTVVTVRRPGDGHVAAYDAADGTELWRVGLERVRAHPAVADGTVYVASSEGVHALDVGDGSEQWHYEGDVSTTPTAADGRVIVGTSNDGAFVALDAADGTEQWRIGSSEPFDTVLGGPSVADDTVYATATGHVSDGPNRGFVYALDAADGTEQWRATVADGPMKPTVADGAVYVGTRAGTCYAFDGASGSELWQFETGGLVRSPPVVDGTAYLASKDGFVYALAEVDDDTGTDSPGGDDATAGGRATHTADSAESRAGDESNGEEDDDPGTSSGDGDDPGTSSGDGDDPGTSSGSGAGLGPVAAVAGLAGYLGWSRSGEE